MTSTVTEWQHTLSSEQIQREKSQPKRDFAYEDADRGPCIPYDGSNNPRAGQWDGRIMSKNMIADYKRFVVVDGIGVRCSLYVSGCPFHCEGCFQPSIFNFRTGVPYTEGLEDQIIKDLDHGFVDGITFLGGEPMLNTPTLIPLAKRIRKTYGDSKTIWCWTGYTWEELHHDGETPDKLELLSMIDVLVDGRFIKKLADPMLQFRGSSNQRIIDVRKSTPDVPHIWDDLHDEHLSYKDLGINDRNVQEGIES